METESQVVKACPRCGDQFETLRRFTRWGRTVMILLCRSCGYTAYEARAVQGAGRGLEP
ncbi:MAG TPA: hypothetical protein VID28_08220 [Methylomirabilota bacterium]|jgi:predicted RNA-binding Zn-ribbon protein involved in translation (DUF1610 family)